MSVKELLHTRWLSIVTGQNTVPRIAQFPAPHTVAHILPSYDERHCQQPFSFKVRIQSAISGVEGREQEERHLGSNPNFATYWLKVFSSVTLLLGGSYFLSTEMSI